MSLFSFAAAVRRCTKGPFIMPRVLLSSCHAARRPVAVIAARPARQSHSQPHANTLATHTPPPFAPTRSSPRLGSNPTAISALVWGSLPARTLAGRVASDEPPETTTTTTTTSSSSSSPAFVSASSNGVLGEPIAFSQTRARSVTIDETLGIPKEKENKYSPYILMAIGVLICGSIAYKMITTDEKTQKEYFAKDVMGLLVDEETQKQIQAQAQAEAEAEAGNAADDGTRATFVIPNKPPPSHK